MATTSKLKLLGIGLLVVLTIGLHTVYRAHANASSAERTRRAEAFFKRPVGPKPETKPVKTVEIAPETAPIRVLAQADRSAIARSGDGTVHVEVTIETGAKGPTPRTPTDLIVIVDRSGSMSGDKLDYAKHALRQLISRLEPEDRLSLVSYETAAELRIPPTHASAEARRSWLREVDELEVAGGTNMSAGLDLALRTIERSSSSGRAGRVLLMSDGLANEGDASFTGLVERTRRAARADYVVSSIGIGSDFDERLMTALASSGTGGFYYLAKLDMLPRLLDAELKTATETFAHGAELHLELPANARLLDATGSSFEQHGSHVVVPLGSLYAGHRRKVWFTLGSDTKELGDYPLGRLSVTYKRKNERFRIASVALPSVRCVADEAAAMAGIHRDVWERAMLEEELTRAQEQLGDVIASGTEQDVDRTMERVRANRKLAADLGSSAVLKGLDETETQASSAKAAQRASADQRKVAAKRQKASGFGSRNSGSYRNIDPAITY